MVRSGIYLITVLVLFVCSCTTSLTGNSSETSNGIMVIAGNGVVEGKAPSYSSIYLIDKQFNPSLEESFDSITTDSTGQFRFTLQNGYYHLFVNGRNGLKSFVNIYCNQDFGYRDTIYDSLSPTGSFLGYSPYPRSEGFRSFLYLQGSPFFTEADSSGFFRMTEIPTGYYKIIKWVHNYKKHSDVSSIDTVSEINSSYISVKSDTTLTIDW